MKTNTSAREALYEHADACNLTAADFESGGYGATPRDYNAMARVLTAVARNADDDLCEVVAQTWEKGQ